MTGPGAAGSAGNLPAEVTSFVGRQRETAVLSRLLGDQRLLTLTGGAGVGKTRLALRVASEVAHAFRDGVWLVELSPLEDDTFLAQRVADAVGVPCSTQAPQQVLAEFLADKNLLLVLDNCEHLVQASQVLVSDLLRTCAGLRVLATSRQPLRAPEEWLFDVPPLSVPDGEQPSSAIPETRDEAVRLFADRARTALPSFAVDAANQETVVRLCQRLGGIPLAIELAAVQVRAMPPERILARLEDHYLQTLGAGARASVPRRQTLQASIDWSFDLCSEQEQRVWARASVFRGGFDLDAAEHVCSAAGVDRDEMLGLISGLANKSVLTRHLVGETGRYGMLETIREYGLQRLETSGEAPGVRRRHRDHFAELARRADQRLLSPEELQVYTALSRDHANLRAALEFGLTEPSEAGSGLEIAAALSYYWAFSGRHREGRVWMDRGLAADTEPSQARAKALPVNAWLAALHGDQDTAQALIDRCRLLAQQTDDAVTRAYATQISGVAARYLDGDARRALTLLEDALAQLRARGERAGVWYTQLHLMLTAALAGDADRTRCYGDQAVEMADAAGGPLTRPWSLGLRGVAEWLIDDRQRAAQLVRESLATLPSTMLLPFRAAQLLEVLAWDAAARDQAERAARLLGTAHTSWSFTTTPPSRLPTAATEHVHWEWHVRAALGEQKYRTLFDEGAALTTDRAIAYALGDGAC